MKHTCSKCGHEDEINPAKLLASIRTPKKEAAWKANGERLRKMYANARKLDSVPFVVKTEHATSTLHGDGSMRVVLEDQIPPKPTTLEGKKAVAMAALARATNPPLKPNWAETAVYGEKDLHATPCAPFDVNLGEGEPHRVTQMGKRLGLFYMGGGEPVFTRHLQPGELEKFWEARIRG